MNVALTSERPALEVADVIRRHGQAFLQRHGRTLTSTQKKALRDIANCRTAVLGGHLERCADCGHERVAYDSCRNRHCPKCQASARAVWLEREATYLLPVEYHHVVFTLLSELAELAAANPAAIYNLLFAAASQTLKEVAANPKRLGAQIGVLAVLHTWGQNLHHHPHLHCVVTGGGLSCDAKGKLDASLRWVSCPAGFFLPVRVLSRVFRGKFLAGVRALFAEEKLRCPGRLAAFLDETGQQAWLKALACKDWVVYAKPPFGGPEQVLKYLARYTHRVAISNQRLESLEEGKVSFRYKDYAQKQDKTMTLSADEFLRRFVQHVLPQGFVKIRHYGLLGNRHREERLELCRCLLLVVLVLLAATKPQEKAAEETRFGECPQCGGRRSTWGEEVAAQRSHAALEGMPTPGKASSGKGVENTS